MIQIFDLRPHCRGSWPHGHSKSLFLGQIVRKASLKGSFLPKKVKNSESEVENISAVVFWAKYPLRLNIKRIKDHFRQNQG